MLSDAQFPSLNGNVVVPEGTLRECVRQGEGQVAKSWHH